MIVSDKPYMMPELFEINRLPMHGAEIPFGSHENAKSGIREKSPWYRCIDGTWNFSLFKKPEAVPAGFAEKSCKIKGEGTIRVPSNWTMEGFFDKPIYTNIKMPFPCLNDGVVPELNPTGIYRRDLRIPASWKDRRVILHVGAAESYLEVYLNGKFIGMGKDTRLPSEFDLTDHVIFGKPNFLVCKVIRWSDSTLLEDQDQWWMAGIYRSCYVYSTEYVYLEDVYANGNLNPAAGSGRLSLEAHLGFQLKDNKFYERWTGPENDFLLRAELFNADGKSVAKLQKSISHSFREDNYTGILEKTLKKVRPWSSEDPYLYTLVIELLDAKGALLDCRRKRIGFRNVSIQGTDLLINGKRVMIRGVNRHEHSMTGGKTLTMEEMLQDIRLLKQYNFNAVRTCHYPDDHRWYDLCDEYGLYVLDEADYECHAHYPLLCRDPRYRDNIVKRGQRMVRRDRSHACIYGWSLCNESGNGENHVAEAEAILALDKTRAMHHEGELKHFWSQGSNKLSGGMDWINNFYDEMYPSLETLLEYAGSNDSTRPCILCEYAHAMGNSSGSLSDYWDLFLAMPKLQGGFIWDWIDQGLLTRNAKGQKMLGFGGDFGEVLHDLDFCCNGMIAADRRIHPGMNEFRHLTQPVKVVLSNPKKLKFTLVSMRDFTTLADLNGTWELQIDGTTVAKDKLTGFATLESGHSAEFTLPIRKFAKAVGKEAFLNFRFTLAKANAWANAGTLLAHDQIELTPCFAMKQPKGKTVCTQPVLIKSGKNLILRNGNAVMTIDAATGKGSLAKDGETVLNSLFTCNLFRAATDNDGIRKWTGQENKPMGKWLAAGLDQLKTTRIKVSGKTGKDGVSVTIDQTLIGRDPKAPVKFTQVITARKDGKFLFAQNFELPESFPSMPRIGVAAETAKGFEGVEWFGRGPWENYSDRCRSAHVGKYADTVSGMYEDTYIVPQENGNRTGVRYAELASRNTILRISGEKHFEFSVSHYTDADLFGALHQCELTPRKETILKIDLAQRGLGTGSCGPQTRPEYELAEKRYAFQFELEVKESNLYNEMLGKTACRMGEKRLSGLRRA